jgi:hypothetical protein
MSEYLKRLEDFEQAEGLQSALVECVPNFSEGRRREVIEAIVTAMSRPEGSKILHVTSDPDHNRTVITMAGSPKAMAEAALCGMEEAKRHILGSIRASIRESGLQTLCRLCP